MPDTLPIRIKLFAVYQEVIGQSELQLQISPGTSVGQVLDRLLQQYPALERWRSQTRFGINQDFVEADRQVQAGDEVVFVPPVSGG